MDFVSYLIVALIFGAAIAMLAILIFSGIAWTLLAILFIVRIVMFPLLLVVYPIMALFVSLNQKKEPQPNLLEEEIQAIHRLGKQKHSKAV